jgi:hypothetical protein
MMRRFKKQRVYAIVRLSNTLMSKKYNRQRPDLIVQQWITLDGSSALPVPETPAITGPTTAPTSTPATTKPATAKETLDQFAGVKTVTPPTAKKATDDETPF